MIGDLFDSPWKILILAVVILVLFGSRKLPAAARSLGQSMRILKTEINTLHDDEKPKDASMAPEALPSAAITHQQQVDQLQQQLDELRKHSAATDAQQTHQAS
jgi:sec-independent protein translocase protein TatA